MGFLTGGGGGGGAGGLWMQGDSSIWSRQVLKVDGSKGYIFTFPSPRYDDLNVVISLEA